MANVSLRSYSHEIESLVEHSQLDEAIAHCVHILKTFPKHLDTYRMLGKAYLEARRYEAATDIFQRVLMADPSDFVAHVGMSIIADEKQDMDAAIWHMERAFEVQPSNSAIQAELQRLYGRRDGVEPPKIRLTRGALAHMYVQGELYPQAISEIRNVLEEDPERQDMQVLLARAYFHAGQKNEAAEICSTLIGRYPYCLDANRVLVELLPSTEIGESTQTYRLRVNELDPYSAFVKGSIFHSEDVPDESVSLGHLEWDGQPIALQPDWGTSLGIKLSGGKPNSRPEEPDWLKSGLEAEVPTGSEPSQEPASAGEAGDAEDIPAFLREAGWGESTGAFQEGQESPELPEQPALAAADLPDWIKAMAPEGADMSAAAGSPGETEAEGGKPDWLESVSPATEAGTKPLDHAEIQPADDSNLPDWLTSVTDELEEAAEAPDLEESDILETNSSPDVQPEPEATPLEEQTEPSVEVVDSDKPVVPEPGPVIDFQPAEDLVSSDEEQAPIDFDRTETGSLGTSATEQDDAFSWLEGLAAKHGAKSEELLTTPDDRLEEEPEWVQQAKTLGTSELQEESQGAQSPVEETEDQLPAAGEFEPEPLAEPNQQWEPEPGTVEKPSISSQAVIDEEMPASENEAVQEGAGLLDELESLKSAFDEGGIVEPDDETGIWLRKLDDDGFGEQAETPAEAGAEPINEGELPDWLQEMETGGSGREENPTEVAGEWKAEIDSDANTTETYEVDETSQGLTNFLKELEAESPEPESAAEPEAVVEPRTVDDVEDLPSWLAGLDSAESEESASPDDDLPEWLSGEAGEGEQASEEPQRVAPVDWQPMEEASSDEKTPEPELLPEEEPVLPAQQPKAESEPEVERLDSTSFEEVEAAVSPSQPESAPSFETQPVEPVVEDELRLGASQPEAGVESEPAARTHTGTAGNLSVSDDPQLNEIQAELASGNIPGAMAGYDKLIKKGRLLEEVIFDLREAMYRYPVEVGIWQTLGDAYMRANRLQEALDAYTKAEELLR